MSETIRVGDQDVEPLVIRGVPCLNVTHAAALLGITPAALTRKAKTVKLTKLTTPLRGREVFYPVVQLYAVLQGHRTPRVEVEGAGEELEEEVRRIDPDMIDNVPCLDEEQAAYYLNMQVNNLIRWSRAKGVKTREQDGETYYALAQLIAWRRGETIPDVEW